MKKYIIRLDDAAEKMDLIKWQRIEELLDKFDIKPIVGVIPNCKDSEMDKFQYDDNFWCKVKRWENKGWLIAMHGYEHLYVSNSKGINPIHNRSEFAGLPYNIQEHKIKSGYEIFLSKRIEPKIFFAPSHTFDENTLLALKNNTNIRIVSDTIAFDIYRKNDFIFIPQQSGKVRRLPFKCVTFCYHPNLMSENDFIELEKFISLNRKYFMYEINLNVKRKYTIFDKLLSKIYFFVRKLRRIN